MKKENKTRAEILTDLIKAQDDLFEEIKYTNGMFIEKIKLDKIFHLNQLYKDFNPK